VLLGLLRSKLMRLSLSVTNTLLEGSSPFYHCKVPNVATIE
jgi:hypothetical protein